MSGTTPPTGSRHDFTGKVAIVTGAAQGIGEAYARALAAAGAAVVIADISKDAGQAVADDIRAAGGQAAFARTETERLNALFPEGLKMTLGTIICDGPSVAVQAACDTTAMNGRRYLQRYHFYLRFEGHLIAEGLEYNDTNLVREVFLS